MNTIEQVIQNTSVCVCVCVLDDFAEETDIHTHTKKTIYSTVSTKKLRNILCTNRIINRH